MVAAWGEELRESRRKICATLGTENPSLEDIKIFALAPSPDGSSNFPRIWDLSDPAGYYQTVVVPRQERQMSRLLHKQLHDANLKSKKAAGEVAPTQEEEEKPGKAPRINLRSEDDPSKPSKSAYPAGKRLAPQEPEGSRWAGISTSISSSCRGS